MSRAKRWNVLELLEWTAGYFERAGIPTPRLDAELLLARALERDRMWLYLNFEQIVSDGPLDRFREHVKRRHAREPVAYLTGTREFMSIPFEVTRGTLIPRPETETLAELALELLAQPAAGDAAVKESSAGSGGLKGRTAADIGCGSGAVGVALAASAPGLRVVATDISEEALRVAERNAQAAGVGAQMEFRLGDGDAAFREGERFDAVVSNPPYVPTGRLESLPPEARLYEPHTALDGGPDGFQTLRELIAAAPRRLKKGGFAAFEVGDGQAAEALALMEASGGFAPGETALDLAGVERVVWARRL